LVQARINQFVIDLGDQVTGNDSRSRFGCGLAVNVPPHPISNNVDSKRQFDITITDQGADCDDRIFIVVSLQSIGLPATCQELCWMDYRDIAYLRLDLFFG